MLRQILLLLLVLYSGTVRVQGTPLINYTIENGFPSNHVYNVYKDKKGYLWFATEIGVIRYNGLKFEHFTSQDGLADNIAFYFVEDHECRLWIGLYNGELCFYKNGKFYNARNTPFLRLPFKPFHMRYITVEPDSSISFFHQDKSRLINIKGNRLQVFNIDKSINTYSIIYLRKLKNGVELLYPDKRVLVNKQGKIIRSTAYRRKDKYHYFFNDKQQYLLSDKGVFTLDEQLLQPLTAALPSNYTQYIISVLLDDNAFFLCTRDGLITKGNIRLLKGMQVSAIVKDGAGNYWISTIGNGVYHLSMHYNTIKEFTSGYKGHIRNAQLVNSVLYFLSDDRPGSLQMVESGGVKTMTEHAISKSAGGDYLLWMSFLVNKNLDYYYFCSPSRFVARNLNTRQLYADTSHPLIGNVKKIFEKDNHLFLLKKSEITSIDIAALRKNKKLLAKEIITAEKVEDLIFSQAQDIDSNIWYSTASNTYKIVNNVGVAQHQLQGKTFDKFVFTGNYLVGFNKQNQLFVCHDPNDRARTATVNNNNILWNDLYALDNSHVLLSANKAYFLLTLSKTDSMPRYTLNAIEDPFLPLQAEYICADSNFCFFFKKGAIYQVPTQQLYNKPPAPSIFFTGIKAKKTSWQIRDEVKIAYNNSRDIRIEFNAIAFASKELKYQYSISGSEQDNWVDINSQEINLHNPAFGNYNVKVRVKNIANQYTPAATFKLVILRPFWATWWFILYSAAIIILIITISIRWIVRRMMHARQQKAEARIKYEKAEYKALNALMNPHFIFNSINNIQALINDHNKREANKYLVTFSNLIRQNMHNISKGLVSIQDEINLTHNYLTLEKLRFKKDVQYNICIDKNVAAESILIPPLMIQPLVENSIKHRRVGNEILIGIKVYIRDKFVYIEVSDNGSGLQGTAKNPRLYPSFSLDNMEKRARHLQELYGQQISFSISEIINEDKIVKGTLATVKVALSDRS